MSNATEVALAVASDSTPVRQSDRQSDWKTGRHSGGQAGGLPGWLADRLFDQMAEYLNVHRAGPDEESAAMPLESPEATAGPPGTRKAFGKPLGRFALTYYWVAHERDRRGRRNTRIYDPTCEPIAKVSGEFAARLAREGTGKLADGRVVNVAGPCECEYSPCFFHLDDEKSRFGVGVLERPLSPFRSVAVDPSFVTIGKRLYIPELDGLAMPGTPPWGGFVHDGCVVADDRGGNVQGQQIDFFMVRRVYYQAFSRRHRLKQITVHDGGKYCREQHANTALADRNAI